MACVYWAHLPNHKDILTEGYIGFSVSTAEKRWKYHNHDSTKKRMQEYPFCRAIKKHGKEIIVDTLVVGDNEYCLDVERKLRPARSIGWNIAIGGKATNLNGECSEKTKEKLRAANIGKKLAEETKRKLKAIPRTKQWRENASKSHMGNKPSPDVLEKMRKRMTGLKLSEETKEKIRQKALGHKRNVGRKLRPETIEKIRLKATGRVYSQEVREARKKRIIENPIGAESRLKMSVAKKTIIKCPFCDKIGGAGGMYRYHFNNCKSK